MTKEQFRKFHKSFMLKYEEIQKEEITIDSEHDTFSEGYDFQEKRMKRTFEQLGKLLEEIEYYGLK